MTKSATFADVLVALEWQYPTYETDLSIRAKMQNLPMLPNNPKPGRVSELLADLDHWAGRLTPGSYSSDALLFWLVAKLLWELWDECCSTAEHKARALHYEDLCVLLLELALEKGSDQHLNNYRPGGGGSGSHGKGYQGSGPGQGTTCKHARIMENVKEVFWCDTRDGQGHLQHAPDCEQQDCFVVQVKQQEKNTGAKAKLPDHYRCTITCAFCGKRKHYEDECYPKKRLSAKLKGEDPCKGSGKGGGKGKGNDSGKRKSKGRGQGQDKSPGGRGGGANRQPYKDNKNTDKNGGNPNPNPGGKSKPSGGQSGPTTRSQTQVQQEQGAKLEHEGGDDGNAKKRTCLMRMARKLRNKGFEVTCPAEFSRGRSGGAQDLVFLVCIQKGGREYLGVLDTGATISIVAKKTLPCGSLGNTMTTAAIRMGDGHVVHSCGDCEVEVRNGSRTIVHRFHVMDTESFDFVLGTDFFLQHSQIQSLTLQAPYLLYMDHGSGRDSVPLEQSEHTSSYPRVSKEEPSNMMAASKTEDYQLLGEVLDQGLKELGYSREDLSVELFASDMQHVLDLYCSKNKNCSYKFYWPSFGIAYGNPRFSELGKVLTKVALERSCMVLCSPDWGAHGGNEYWRNLLDRLTISSVRSPDEAIDVPLGRKTPIGKPGLGSMLSVVEGGLTSIPWEDLDPTLVQTIQPESDGLALGDLKDRLRPQDAIETTPGGDEYVVTNTNAPNSPRHVPVPDGVSECGLSELPRSILSDDETEHDAFFMQTCVEEVENAEYVAPLRPLLSMRVEDPVDEDLDPRSRLREYVDSKRKLVAKKLCYAKPTRSSWPLKQGRMGDLCQLKKDLETKITTWQREVDLKLMKSVWGAHVRTPEEDDLSEECVCEPPRACLSCHCLSEIVEQDLLYAYQGLKDTTKGEESVEDNLPTSITQGASNLHSDEDMEDKIKLLDPRVQKLIRTYLEVFGELPPPASCDKLVQMDLKLKPEFVGHKIRRSPYPASEEQANEIERQIQEYIDARLVLEYKDGDYPQHCSPCFLVAKPGSTAKRLVVDYGELNKKTLNHSGSIRNMESTLEKIASCRYETKMDKRSGFWQVDLTPDAQELLAFITPQGRVFKWKVLPFGRGIRTRSIPGAHEQDPVHPTKET